MPAMQFTRYFCIPRGMVHCALLASSRRSNGRSQQAHSCPAKIIASH